MQPLLLTPLPSCLWFLCPFSPTETASFAFSCVSLPHPPVFEDSFLVSGSLSNYHVYLLLAPFYYPQCISSGVPELLPTVHFFRRTIWFPFSNLSSVKIVHLHSLGDFIGISFFQNIYFYLFVVCICVHTLCVGVP